MSASGFFGGNGTLSLWSLCCVLKCTQSIVHPIVEIFVCNSGIVSTMVQTFQE